MRTSWAIITAIVVGMISGCLPQTTTPNDGFGWAQELDEIRFKHEPHIASGVQCTDCHLDVESRRVSHQVDSHKPCRKCHSEFVPTKKSGKRPLDDVGKQCDFCHTNVNRIRSSEDKEQSALVFSHEKHRERVDKTQCLYCHGKVTRSSRHQDNLNPSMDICLGCHQSEYGQMKCKHCHVRLRDQGLLPLSQYSHLGQFVQEHGAHAARDPILCSQCHAQRDCDSCHETRAPFTPSTRVASDISAGFMHRGAWMDRHGMEATRRGDTCVRCHQRQSCQNCHEAAGLRRSSGTFINPHPRGWALDAGSINHHGRQAASQIITCLACHEMDRPGSVGSNCILCHADLPGSVGGNPHPRGFQTLLGKDHPACRSCHPD